MLIYTTKLSKDRFSIAYESKLPSGVDDFYKWGGKIFYQSGKKCLQFINFKTRFGIFLFDLSVSDMDQIFGIARSYLVQIFKGDPDYLALLEKYFLQDEFDCFFKLSDRSVIGTLNTVEFEILSDSFYFDKFTYDGLLNPISLAIFFNFKYLIGVKVDGKKAYYHPGELFKRELERRFKE